LDELQSQPPITRLLDDLEAAVGSLPISVRAWYEIVGSLNLVGYHSGWRAILTGGDREEEAYSRDGETDPISFLEPLYVYPLSAGRVADYVERAAKGGRVQGFRLSLIPNGKRAYGLRGQDAFDYEITLPCDAADAALLGTSSGTTFIGYLRSCFRWGGFPNWGQWSERPERDLEILQQGLLPI
jgi:hypothetical protein